MLIKLKKQQQRNYSLKCIKTSGFITLFFGRRLFTSHYQDPHTCVPEPTEPPSQRCVHAVVGQTVSDLRTLLIHQFISITDSTLVYITITLIYPYRSELLDLPSWPVRPSMTLFTGINKDTSKSLCTLSQGNDLISFVRHVGQITERRVIYTYSQLLWRQSEASLSRCADAKTRTVPPSSPSTQLSITSFSGGLKSNS